MVADETLRPRADPGVRSNAGQLNFWRARSQRKKKAQPRTQANHPGRLAHPVKTRSPQGARVQPLRDRRRSTTRGRPTNSTSRCNHSLFILGSKSEGFAGVRSLFLRDIFRTLGRCPHRIRSSGGVATPQASITTLAGRSRRWRAMTFLVVLALPMLFDHTMGD